MPAAVRWSFPGKPLKALSGERSPGFDTILKVIHALGLKLHAETALMADTPSR